MIIVPPEYHPVQDAIFGSSSQPLLNTPEYIDREHWLLSVQPFRSGGFEATLLQVDLQAAADRAMRPRKYGARLEDDSPRSQLSLDSSCARAKSTVRKRIKDFGGNRLCTLTIRQSDDIGYFSPDDWADAFARYVRILRKYGLLNDYVSVLEPHKIGLDRLAARRGDARKHCGPAIESWDIPMHMHFITRSVFKLPIHLMRKCWAIASGRSGNIDVQRLVDRSGRDSVDRIASYATKYITKSVSELERFNKKRYWAAGQSLLKKGHSWLVSRTRDDALEECMRLLSISAQDMANLDASRCIYRFPNACGAWLNIRPGMLATPPPF